MSTSQKKPHTFIKRLRTTPALIITSFVVVASSLTAGGFAVFAATCSSNEDCQSQINDLSTKNAQAQGSLNDLLAQASSFQDAISKLQGEINGLQAQISANQAQQASLQTQITDAETKLNQQKAALGDNLKVMYLNGQLTPQEMLASSNNLSDYIDKQQAYSSIQNKVQDTLKQISDLQSKLKIQKGEVDTLVASQQSQYSQLASTQYQQNSMLAYNEAQQNDFNSQIKSNSGAISDLRKQQIILNTKYNIGNFKGDPGNGGYPNKWAYAPQDSLIDSWGMYNRECVSYTAFMVHQMYLEGRASRDMPWWGGIGNANQWDDNARNSGIPVDNNPTVGSIAISNSGYYGHAMYVAAVSGDRIYIQQYNASLNGTYSEGWRYTTGLVFLHF